MVLRSLGFTVIIFIGYRQTVMPHDRASFTDCKITKYSLSVYIKNGKNPKSHERNGIFVVCLE